MNLGSLLSGVLSLFSGGISDLFKGDNLGNAMGKAGREYSDIGNQNNLGNLFAKVTGSRLTDSEREANEFNASQAELAFNRELQADSTRYQRTVADMQAAGINPMMAASGAGGSSVSAPAAQSVSPSSGGDIGSILGMLLNYKMFGLNKLIADAQVRNINADTALKEANAANAAENTRGAQIVNDIREASKSALIESNEWDAKLKSANHRMIFKRIDEISVNMSKSQAEIETEYSKQAYYEAKAILDKANVHQIYAMLPYQQQLAEAKTEEARAAASLAMVHTAYQQGLIDNGAIESTAKQLAEAAGLSENQRIISDIATGLRTGDFSKTEGILNSKGWLNKSAAHVLQGLTIVVDNLNPLKDILK